MHLNQKSKILMFTIRGRYETKLLHAGLWPELKVSVHWRIVCSSNVKSWYVWNFMHYKHCAVFPPRLGRRYKSKQTFLLEA